MKVDWAVLGQVRGAMLRERGLDPSFVGTWRMKQYRGSEEVEIWVGMSDGTDHTQVFDREILTRYGVVKGKRT
jgi:hypothetical protein